MTHPATHHSDDDLLLEYYGEPSAPSSHLAECAECAERFHQLRSTLDDVTLEAPERGDQYGLEVWQAIRHRLPARESWWHSMLGLRPVLAAAAAVVLLVAGFTAGRMWPSGPSEPQIAASPDTGAAPALGATDEDAQRRVVLSTVTDHFDRSDRVLAEIMNAPGPRELMSERQSARDLVAASRLYRQSAVVLDEPAVAAVLEEVERVLLDVVHQPPTATAADLNEIRRRIESASLLFKLRVMANELQQRLEESPSTATTSSTSTIG
jgi:hypothetical protein